LIDGPKGSLRRLRSRLAEDGCPESQVILAKQLLEEQCGKLEYTLDSKVSLLLFHRC